MKCCENLYDKARILLTPLSLRHAAAALHDPSLDARIMDAYHNEH
jgi:hypothetical protein